MKVTRQVCHYFAEVILLSIVMTARANRVALAITPKP